MDVNLADRMAELERRVQELETRQDPPPALRSSAQARSDFWALDGVRESCEPPGGVVFAGSVELPDGRTYEWQEQHATTDLMDHEEERLDGAAETLAALGHPARLALLTQVLAGRTETSELVTLEHFGTSGQFYHHAKTLIAAGWLVQARRGNYLVPPDRIVPLLVALAIGGARR